MATDPTHEAREHRWPKQDRGSFPTRWVMWYSLRRIVFFTPKVRLRSWQIVVSTFPKGAWLVGVQVWRDDEDGDLTVTIGVGFLDVEIITMRFLSDAEVEARYV